ncbi:MAG: hypothetical protein IKW48_07335 [Akkermansia sp.]|nr:hypothetical protein [Akkermansia sp.]
MRICLTLSSLAIALLASCSQYQTTCITGMADLPLKTTELPSDRWQEAPLRANAQYILYGANSKAEKKLRIGDYYFLRWYDAEPSRPVKIEMLYTQALTGADVLTRTVEYNEPREDACERKEKFQFSGADYAKRGDIMTWKVNLYCGGELVDSLQSYLWE